MSPNNLSGFITTLKNGIAREVKISKMKIGKPNLYSTKLNKSKGRIVFDKFRF
jgi:hypothetical protein